MTYMNRPVETSNYVWNPKARGFNWQGNRKFGKKYDGKNHGHRSV